MSFSIGSIIVGMGPRDALDNFGRKTEKTPATSTRTSSAACWPTCSPTPAMSLALLLTLVESALTLLTPYLIKIAIDQYITPGDLQGLLGHFALHRPLFVSSFFVSSGQRYILSWVGQRVLANIRGELFRHLQRLHLGYHDNHIIGVTVSRVINDVAEINELLSQGVITLLGDMVVLVGIIIIMLTMSPKLALLTFTVLPLMFLATWLFSRQARIAFRETRSKVAAVVGDLAEDISGMRAIQAFTQEKASQERFERGQPAKPRRLHQRHVPLLHFPAHDRIPGHAGHRHRAVVRRPLVHRAAGHPGGDGGFPLLRHPLLPAHPGAQPAVHHLPVGHGWR